MTDEAPKTLKEELAKLQTDLEGAQTTEKHATTKIGALTQLVDEIEKIVEQYEKDHPDLAKAQGELAEYQANEKVCLSQILGTAAGKVETTVKDVRNDIDCLEKEVKKLEEARNTAKEARDTAVKARDDHKARLEKWKKLTATTKARHQQLNTLKTEIGKAHDAGEYAVAYWLLTDDEKFAGTLKAKPDVVAPGELQAKIESVWADYSESVVTAENAEVALKHAEKALADKSAKLADLKSKLEANIRSALKELQPARAAA